MHEFTLTNNSNNRVGLGLSVRRTRPGPHKQSATPGPGEQQLVFAKAGTVLALAGAHSAVRPPHHAL